MTTGEKIRQARIAKKMTQAELAQKLGISATGVAQWERNFRNPKLGTLAKISQALGMTVNDLLGSDWSGVDMRDAFSLSLFDEDEDILETRILAAYNSLNEAGKEKAVERVEELALIPKYKK